MDEEAKRSSASHGLEVVEAEPLTVLAPVRRSKRTNLNILHLKDAKELFGLPEGWQVEQRARTNAKYIGKVDQYFYEPVTRKQFRSLKSVFSYLDFQMHRNQQTSWPQTLSQLDHIKAPKSFKPESTNKPEPSNKHSKKIGASSFNLQNPPENITWVLTDAEKHEWTPFLKETKVRDQEKFEWAETFVFMNGGKKMHLN